MEIALAKNEDIDGILALQTQIYRIDTLPEVAKPSLEKLLNSQNCQVFVAKEKDKVLGSGFAFYMPVPAHGKEFAFLEGLVVDKDARGKGIGTKLSQFAMDLAKKRGCYKIIFTSGFDREEVHSLYEKLGFKKWGYEFRMNLGD